MMECKCCNESGNFIENTESGNLMDVVVFESILKKKMVDNFMIEMIFSELGIDKNKHHLVICLECRQKVYNAIKKQYQNMVKYMRNEFKV